jgi:hypothetical protein
VVDRRGPPRPVDEDGPENGMIASWLPNPATCGRACNQAVIMAGEGRGADGHDTFEGKHA